VKYLEMSSEERRRRVGHHAVPSVARRTATTVAVGTAGLLAAAVLGWFAAGDAGLAASTRDAPPGQAAPESSSATDWAEPAMRRTVDLTTTPPRRTETRAARPETADEVAPSTVSRPSAPVPEPAAVVPPVRSAPPTVQQGAPCPTEGDTGVTRSGDPAVCTGSAGNGSPRWRHA
jgi:hypothetical protein